MIYKKICIVYSVKLWNRLEDLKKSVNIKQFKHMGKNTWRRVQRHKLGNNLLLLIVTSLMEEITIVRV